MNDPQLWKYVDHRERADKLVAERKPLSIHFSGEMYVYGGEVYAPLWIGNTYVWIMLPLCGGDPETDLLARWQDWRRRKEST